MSKRRKHFPRLMIVTLVTCLTLFTAHTGYSNPFSEEALSKPVNFSALTLSHDDEKQTVTATGDVELVQGEQVLRADKVVYNLAEDRVAAIGNVSLLDAQGNVHFAEYVQLENKMKDGFVQGLLTLLADGSRFTATEARRENNGMKTTMTEASYTMCKVCEIDPKPLWQIKAKEVVHDAEKKTVKYKDARLEMFGVPLAYSPIFSHPDPTLKQKSGFLRPQYGWSNLLGAHFREAYYWGISPDKDLTLAVQPTSLAGTVVDGEWRQRFSNGEMKIAGSTVNSDRANEDGTIALDRQRGHVFADGRFDLSKKWRAGFDVARASDKEYLRLYDLARANNVLVNDVYAERFSGRDYSRISAYNFQDVRLGTRMEQPDILPMVDHQMIGEPTKMLGGRWEFGVGTLGLARPNGNQDMMRGSMNAGWERRGITNWGLSNVLRVDGRADMYDVHDSDASKLNPLYESDPTTVRGIATATLISSYPLVKSLPKAQWIVEPIAGISVSPKINQPVDEIPNEDSIDVRFDTNNLFFQNRFPGIDRQEDGGRLNYGVKTGLYGDNGRYGKLFVGRSYRFYGDKIFPNGSGLESRDSDLVGQVKVGLARYLTGDYRFQVDGQSLQIKRHEVQAEGGNERFRLTTRYLYTDAVAGTGFTEAREQIGVDGSYNITKEWQFAAAALTDVGEDPGLRNASTGVIYSDECFTFAVIGSRSVADAASGQDESKITIRLGLKTLGEFSGPQIPVGGTTRK